jgi:hypothetical protein
MYALLLKAIGSIIEVEYRVYRVLVWPNDRQRTGFNLVLAPSTSALLGWCGVPLLSFASGCSCMYLAVAIVVTASPVLIEWCLCAGLKDPYHGVCGLSAALHWFAKRSHVSVFDETDLRVGMDLRREVHTYILVRAEDPTVLSKPSEFPGQIFCVRLKFEPVL